MSETTDVIGASGSAVAPPAPVELETVAIRFAGDSGDGMQLTGSRFTTTAALAGNDLSTFPDFPAEIRAPAGTTYGVSGFQVNFSSTDIMTPGDQPDVLVAMNPAALKVNIKDLKRGGILIVNSGAFTGPNLKKAGYDKTPVDDDLKARFQVHEVDITKLTTTALADTGLGTKDVERCKNMFALGLMFWLYGREMDSTITWIEKKFTKKAELAAANVKALKAGYHYGETAEVFRSTYRVPAAKTAPGLYRNISGNSALCLGLCTVAEKTGQRIFFGAYPITPASDILHEISRFKNYGITTFQAEDEIAAIGVAIGASYGGSLGITATSGPGFALKQEALNLAVMIELPLVVINVMRGGPSTGLPTKTEQADLFQALYGRNGESHVAVIAPKSPSDCFLAMIEAAEVAVKHMVPVVLLSDAYLANGTEPWLVPNPADIYMPPVTFRTEPAGFKPFERNPDTYARPWVRPGTPGLEHTIGGLEKSETFGKVSYESDNHDRMVRLRTEKVQRVAVPDLAVEEGPDEGELLVLGWGSTWGAVTQAVRNARRKGYPVSSAHLRWMNPLPKNLGPFLRRFKRVLLPELNLGQAAQLIRGKTLVDVISMGWVGAKPFQVTMIEEKIYELLGDRT